MVILCLSLWIVNKDKKRNMVYAAVIPMRSGLLFSCFKAHSFGEELFCLFVWFGLIFLFFQIRWPACPRMEVLERTFKQACLGLEKEGYNLALEPALHRAELHVAIFQHYPCPKDI